MKILSYSPPAQVLYRMGLPDHDDQLGLVTIVSISLESDPSSEPRQGLKERQEFIMC
jgi:hypothetical protein